VGQDRGFKEPGIKGRRREDGEEKILVIDWAKSGMTLKGEGSFKN